MKAAVLNEIPGELEIEDVSVDKPGPNEVLVQVVNAGLCHSDLHFMDAAWQTQLPAVMGHESAGVVQAVAGWTRQAGGGVVLLSYHLQTHVR